MSSPYTLKGSRQAYDGKFLNVREDMVELSNGHQFTYELVEHPGGAAILPVDAQGNCHLVKQYRHPVEADVIEIPAGRIEADCNDPSENAIRECIEEVGFKPGEIKELGFIYPSPGVVQEVIYLFLGQNLEKTEKKPDAGEILETVVIPFEKLLAMAKTGEISDAKTALAVIRAEKYISSHP